MTVTEFSSATVTTEPPPLKPGDEVVYIGDDAHHGMTGTVREMLDDIYLCGEPAVLVDFRARQYKRVRKAVRVSRLERIGGRR